MVISWSQYLSSLPETPFEILSQFFWYENYIKIEETVIYFEQLSNKTIKFLSRLVSQRDQIKYTIPTKWKILISNYSNISEKNLRQNYHVVKGARVLPTDMSKIFNKPTSNIYFKKLFENTTLDWSKTYLLPRLATINTTLRVFQYKILNNILFLNKKIYNLGITNTALCSFCKIFEETLIHFFYYCINVKSPSKKL